MAKPIALQLYTVREAMNQDFEGTVRKVAEMGYVGVETAGFPGTTPAEAARLFAALDLQVVAAHIGLPLGDKKNEVLDTMGELGCKYLVCPWLNPDEHFSTIEQIKATCGLLNDAGVVAAENGLTLVYHNHHFEYLTVEGRPAYTVMLEHLDPAVKFEVDTYWVQVGGHNPAQVVAELGARALLLHIKDGPAVRGEPMTAVGDGVLDIPAIIKAGEANAEWLIVELDACATDMVEAVARSYTYLTGQGLAQGRQ